jgi:hypothetical protein
MAAPESTKFQVNFKSPDGTLINLYAASKDELEGLLTTAQDFSALISSVSQSLSGSGTSAPVQASSAPRINPLDDRVNPPTQQVVEGQAPSCKHGTMTYRTGTGAKGPWRGWMCAAPKGATDKCATIWA